MNLFIKQKEAHRHRKQTYSYPNCFLLQGIFPTQGSNPGHLHCRQMLYPLSHEGTQYFVITYVLCLVTQFSLSIYIHTHTYMYIHIHIHIYLTALHLKLK